MKTFERIDRLAQVLELADSTNPMERELGTLINDWACKQRKLDVVVEQALAREREKRAAANADPFTPGHCSLGSLPPVGGDYELGN